MAKPSNGAREVAAGRGKVTSKEAIDSIYGRQPGTNFTQHNTSAEDPFKQAPPAQKKCYSVKGKFGNV